MSYLSALGVAKAICAVLSPDTPTITNGGFEEGDLAGWSALGTAGLTTASDTEAHAGTYSCKIENEAIAPITNSGFETGDGTGWTLATSGAGSSATITDDEAHTGTYSVHLIAGTKSGNYAMATTVDIDATLLAAGDSIVITAYVKGTVSATSGIYVYADTVLIDSASVSTSAEWTLVSVTATIPDGMTPSVINIRARSGQGSDLYVDDIEIALSDSGRTQNVTLEECRNYTATCYALMSEIDTTYRMRLAWTDSGGAKTSDATFAVSEDWAAYTLTADVLKGLTGTPTLSFYGTGAGYVDDVSITETDSPTVATTFLEVQADPYIYVEIGPVTLPPDGHAIDRPSEEMSVRVRCYNQDGDRIDDTYAMMNRAKRLLDGATLTLDTGSFAYCLFVDADRVIPYEDGRSFQGVVNFRVRVDAL